MKALNRKLIRDLIHMRGQVIAVGLVVACGVAAFLAMRSNYDSLIETKNAYYRQYRFADVFAHLKRAPERLGARLAEIPGVSAVQTRIVADVTLDVPGLDEPAKGRIISIPERPMPILNDLHLLRGRYIEAGKSDEVIISGSFSEANHLNPGDTLAAIINGRRQRLMVVGVALSPEYVYEIRPGDIFPEPRRFGVMWMSRSALGPAFDMEGAFNDVALTLAPGAKQPEVIERLDKLIEEYGGIGAYGAEDQASNYFITNEIAELRVSGTLIPAIFLGVTAFLLHMVLSRLVITQRDQIAVLKAFGYGNLTIGFHYLQLSFAAILGGVVLGVVFGWWLGYSTTALYAEFFKFPVLQYAPGVRLILTAILISLVSSSLGALVAVRRAVKLPPAEAMRPESPPRFHAGLIERLGLQSVVSPSARIIVRNLVRQPVKAFLSAFGISLSVALLVVGLYLYYDAIDRVIEIQFNTIYREDVSVTFNEPRPSGARYDLAHLPGVIRAEVYRAVPVRLRFGHRTRRLALVGKQPESELWRVVDADYRVFQLPADGLILTAKLAEILGARPGDRLTVEVLEGARPVRQVTLVGTVDDLIGLSAYMDIGALNRLMREGGTISGAHLMVDKRDMRALYATLKRTPAIGAVIVPDAALENFNQTVAKTMNAMTVILILFACIIAFGVVYNSARIALSERGRELASLRVLGFTKREISAMLLGEQAILTGLAVPLGYALGGGLAWLITWAIDTEIMRLPLVITGRTYVLAFLIIAGAALLSGLLVVWRLQRLDLVEVLKTRE